MHDAAHERHILQKGGGRPDWPTWPRHAAAEPFSIPTCDFH